MVVDPSQSLSVLALSAKNFIQVNEHSHGTDLFLHKVCIISCIITHWFGRMMTYPTVLR